jgi:hypothetical protein
MLHLVAGLRNQARFYAMLGAHIKDAMTPRAQHVSHGKRGKNVAAGPSSGKDE